MEPGAFPTGIFDKIGSGQDPAREGAYGRARELAARVGGALSSSKADPADVPRALLVIIETPAGSRAARYRIGSGAQGIEAINTVCAQVQEQLLGALGVAELTRYASGRAS